MIAATSLAREGLVVALAVALAGSLLGSLACQTTPRVGVGPRACRDNFACDASEYCGFSPGLCGLGQAAGLCRVRPIACPSAYRPVCGCDGQIYDSACAARAARVDLDVTGRCKALLPDWAACGARYCDARTSYCELYLSDVFDLPTTKTCRPLPAACRPRDGDAGAPPTCACFPAGTPCLTFCGPLSTGGLAAFHLTCQGVKEPQRGQPAVHP
jgi:hypothetical protein